MFLGGGCILHSWLSAQRFKTQVIELRNMYNAVGTRRGSVNTDQVISKSDLLEFLKRNNNLPEGVQVTDDLFSETGAGIYSTLELRKCNQWQGR